ncbi:MAG: permease [Defluviitaleaceae bacterium]|nr:permease [Defluviitaleaceae bacterium]
MRWYIESIPVLLEHCFLTLLNILPYLAAGILAGEFLKFTSWTKIIYKRINTSPVAAIFSAAAIGMISPLCTFGTIPVVAQLYKSGVRIAPLVTFLAASSLMNPQLFVMTVGGVSDFGLEMALVLTASIFVISFVLGVLAYVIPEKFIVRANLTRDGSGEEIAARAKKVFVAKEYFFNCAKMFKSVGFYVLLGIFIGAIIELYIPQVWIHEALGAHRGVRAVLLAAVLGVPLYACGGGAIPLANSMIQSGMGKGAGLAFFIVGSATRPAPISAMALLFTPKFLVGYSLFLLASSVLIGVFYV